MSQYLLRKLLLMIPGFLGISLLAFAFIHLVPGDPVSNMTGVYNAAPEEYSRLRQVLGLDKSLPEQYFRYLGQLLQGDFGTSLTTGQTVLAEFLVLLPATLELSLLALFLAVAIGLPAGMLAAVKHRRPADYAITGLALAGNSMPIFWWGLLLVGFFSLKLGIAPVAGRLSFLFDIEPRTGFMLIDTWISTEPYAREAFFDALHHLALPALVLATVPTALFALITRSAMLEVLSADYIRAARSFGLGRLRIIAVNALRNALIPVVAVLGLQVSVFFTGALLTETIFSWPGIAKWLLEAVSRRDYMTVQGGLVLIASLALVLNTLFDLLFAWVNPRVRR
ncbi:MAG: ABC transporter permease subunit [Gammaproteobacteria bacterium]|nr:ABC transporter permease subunit [Gammaproteobacteria bacterium]